MRRSAPTEYNAFRDAAVKAASEKQGMDAYDLIGDYMEKAKSGGILMTITEAKDAIAQDYTKELLSSPKALNNITKTAPEVAETFKIMADRYKASSTKASNSQSAAKNLFEPLYPTPNTQNPTKTALKDAEGNGIIGERTGVGNEGAGDSTLDSEILIDTYKNMRNNPDIVGQAHHLNQNAAFKD